MFILMPFVRVQCNISALTVWHPNYHQNECKLWLHFSQQAQYQAPALAVNVVPPSCPNITTTRYRKTRWQLPNAKLKASK